LTNGAAIETTEIGTRIIQSVFGLNPAPINIDTDEKPGKEYLDRLVGVYHSALGFDMTVSVSSGRLLAQITGQQALALSKVAENRFRYKIVDAEIEFDITDDDDAVAVTIYQNGQEIRCERKED
ncbi:MAG: DUF3471 domain-containing protein, partial [Phycisphaerales bacterium]|nr:DUF3471 domain-containing protein [Phycisphaerales bacterium]